MLSVSAHYLQLARQVPAPCFLLRPLHHSSCCWDEGTKGETPSQEGTDSPSTSPAGPSESDAQPSTSSSAPSLKPARKPESHMSLRIKDIATKFKMNTDLRSDEGLSNSIGLVPEMRRNQDFQHQLRLAERRLALQQPNAAPDSGSIHAMPLDQQLRASLDQKYQ